MPAAEDEYQFVSLATLKQMLAIENSMLKSSFHPVISSTFTQVGQLARSVTGIKTCLECTQKDVEGFGSMASNLEHAKEEINIIEMGI